MYRLNYKIKKSIKLFIEIPRQANKGGAVSPRSKIMQSKVKTPRLLK